MSATERACAISSIGVGAGRRRSGRRRLDVRHEGHVDLSDAGGAAQVGDRLIEQLRDLAHLAGTIPEVSGGPLSQLRSGLLRQPQPVRRLVVSAISFSTRATSPVITAKSLSPCMAT